MGLFNIFSKKEKEGLDKGLNKTKTSIFDKISRAIVGKSKIDEDVLDEIEEALITSDIGVETTLDIIERLGNRIAKDKYIDTSEVYDVLKQEISQMLSAQPTVEFSLENLPSKPLVTLVVGVNGVGKTTTIGKLANLYQKAGKKVFLGAADTFRAAAIEQLTIWGDRVGVPVVKQKMGADPASVAFDTLSSAVSNNADVVIIDTAGRLHNKVNLMNELTKIRNVVSKITPDAYVEVLLVLDGSTGQNAYEQAKQFSQATNITAMAITKLDGTARGGVVIGISNQMQIPVKFIGIGEGIDDIQLFDRDEFIESLFEKNRQE